MAMLCAELRIKSVDMMFSLVGSEALDSADL